MSKSKQIYLECVYQNSSIDAKHPSFDKNELKLKTKFSVILIENMISDTTFTLLHSIFYRILSSGLS